LQKNLYYYKNLSQKSLEFLTKHEFNMNFYIYNDQNILNPNMYELVHRN